MSSLRKALLRLLYRIGWRIGPLVPTRLQRILVRAGTHITLRQRPAALDVLRQNLAIATGEPVGDALVRAAVESYLRNFVEVFALPGWTPAMVTDRVVTTGEEYLRNAYADGGAVVALPHSGNWDLAGAWACLTGMPVSTVAERLPAAEFAAFLGFRRALGMEVLAHDDPTSLSRLVSGAESGRLVCLVADRDLGGTGLPVRWGASGASVRMPAGPAMVARRSGAALIPAVCSFAGRRMLISFGPPIEAEAGRDGLTRMTQQVADFFAEQIASRPQDWHMFQPFFAPAVQR
ncbi:MAG: phosphatidylinositol mannoside acyltransferase [Propionibacteriaceae bacterium]|jgi:lauroyl/myristoyl acyltransferase|nr:phosphatidylinositol mannoside acyltransferase [Propionibacteriaceae bacterium]